MSHYFILVGLVFGINLLPAFAPPTWVVLVFYKLTTNMNTIAIIALGVMASASGRYLLALGTRAIRQKLKPQYVANLKHLQGRLDRRRLDRRRRGYIVYFLFFILAPIPSAQLFEAAALMETPLLPITGAFMVGRAISYLLIDSIKSPLGIAIQIACLIALYLLVKIDWAPHLPNKAKS
jgi:membrane protein YqaA with SNARE-associated domain